jgi:REP element-mobilizing transposase RayT
MRLAWYDYRAQGAYFVTICADQRVCLFDDTRAVKALTLAWRSTVTSGVWPAAHEFVVMPNHVHGIVWLPGSGDVATQSERGRAQRSPFHTLEGTLAVTDRESLQVGEGVARPRGTSGLLGAKIGRFKALATKRVRALTGTDRPVWQEDYHDRIIRDARELAATREYILDNPRKWDEDALNPARWARG